jgi:hypothetical protein
MNSFAAFCFASARPVLLIQIGKCRSIHAAGVSRDKVFNTQNFVASRRKQPCQSVHHTKPRCFAPQTRKSKFVHLLAWSTGALKKFCAVSSPLCLPSLSLRRLQPTRPRIVIFKANTNTPCRWANPKVRRRTSWCEGLWESCTRRFHRLVLQGPWVPRWGSALPSHHLPVEF